MPRLRPLAAATLSFAVLALAACGDGESTTGTGSGSAQRASACAKGDLALKNAGTLTVATDKPAYPPYFVDDDPSNGEGFESAVAFAIARRLGFTPADVKWVVEPFNSSYAPGPKDFDFDVNQISITDKRRRGVDFSSPYYTAPQALVVPKGSPLADAKSLADFKDATIGVQIGTTSLEAVDSEIQPTQDKKVFNDSNDVVTALKQKQVDAVVTDLPTAFYITAAQVQGAKLAGQFDAPGGDRWGALLQKGSQLTACVSKAIDELRSSGRLQRITQQWMGAAAGAPKLQ